MRPDPVRAAQGVLVLAALGAGLPAHAEAPPIPPASFTEVPTGLATTDGAAGGGFAGVRTSAIRIDQLGFPYAASAPADDMARGWRLTPSLAASALATNNLNNTATNRRSDIVIGVTPGMLLEVDTTRVKGVVNVAPTGQIYGSDSGQNRIDWQYNGQLVFSVVPESLFIDVRGSGAVQAASGGIAQGPGTVLENGNQIQTSAFQVSPYYVQRFASAATLQVGYAFQQVAQDIGGNGSGGLTPTGQPFFTSQNFTANEFYAVARSGPDLGRLALEGRAISTSYEGTGVLDGAYRRSASLETRYAITREVAALLEGGYQELFYAGVPGFEYNGPLWSVGVQLTPSPDSRVTVRYGRRDGVDSLSLDAVLALGGRTTFYASYAERLTTAAQNAVDLLSTTTLDALGNPVDSVTGAPVVQPFANSFNGVQSGLMRVRGGTASIIQAWPRDTIALSFSIQEMTPVSSAPGTITTAQNNAYANLSWAHELTPTVTAIAGIQAGTFDSPAQGSGTLVAASATLTQQLTPTLAGLVQLQASVSTNDTGQGRVNQNTVLVGLRQTF